MPQAPKSHPKHRYVRLADSPKPWWPWGILPILGLVALFLLGVFYSAPQMQAQTTQSVQQNLDNAGFLAVLVNASGQNITLATPAESEQQMLITSVARATQCDTWLGPLTCPSHVEIASSNPDTQPIDAPQQNLDGSFHDFRFTYSNNQLNLHGEAPSNAEHIKLLVTARNAFDRVNDDMSITGKPGTPDYPLAAARALDVLQQVDRGTAQWRNGVLSVDAQVSESGERAARTSFSRELNAPPLGPFNLQVGNQEASRSHNNSSDCNAQLTKALENTTIQFRFGSDEIDPRSEPLIEKLAGIIKGCAGQLLIAGHTDNVGTAERNQRLSLRRANSVKRALYARGIATTRMRSAGYGERQPIAPNTSEQGRAKNRRITIQLDPTATP